MPIDAERPARGTVQIGRIAARYGDMVKNRRSWGPAVAALVLGLLAVVVVVTFFLGIRGLF